MISYAQNFEDVVLHRALHDVREGFYIDLGAWEPGHDSVTKHFYDQGWSGINVEPVPELYQRLVQQRPRDQNLNVAVGSSIGEVEFQEWVGTGLSSSLPTENEAVLQTLGYEKRAYRVPVTTLAEIAKTLNGRTVDFLKIDVEGSELDVLLGAHWNTFRPRIILLEAIKPKVIGVESFSYEPSWGDWEPILLENGYSFALFDGLNRFYHRSEEPALHAPLSYPANAADGFQLAPGHWLYPAPAAVPVPPPPLARLRGRVRSWVKGS